MSEEKKTTEKATEEKKSKDELRVIAEELTKDYNEAMQSAKFEEAVDINEKIEQAVNEYTSLAREECFARLIAQEDTMLAAVKELDFATIRAVDRKVGEEKIPVREIVDVDKAIDFFKLDKAAGGIGHDKKWANMVEKLNFLLTAQKAVDLGINPKEINDSYAMSALSKDIDMGKTPTSRTNILKTLQTVITAMIGEGYKVTSHDVAFLMSVYSKKGRKALTVTCSNHRYLCRYLAEICHRVVLGKSYEIDYKKAK